ncbi:uncharacterized protein METZ01_LOCUS486856, partial [marine metagenome]
TGGNHHGHRHGKLHRQHRLRPRLPPNAGRRISDGYRHSAASRDGRGRGGDAGQRQPIATDGAV